MSRLTPEEELRPLSAAQKAEIRKGLRAALTRSHIRLAAECAVYQRKYGISYSALRSLLDGELPNYLAAGSVKPRTTPAPSKRAAKNRSLTDEEVVVLLTAYRGAFASRDQVAIQRIYGDFQAKYGVPRATLQKIVTEDHQRNTADYRALREMHAQAIDANRKKADREVVNTKPADYYGRATYCPVCYRDLDANFVPRHGPGRRECRGSGRFGVTLQTIDLERREQRRTSKTSAKKSKKTKGSGSVWTISGGLPGLGRRR